MTEKQAAEEPHIDTTETIVSEKDSENALYANYPNVDEKKLLRKMDLIILPTLGFCQVFNFLDRINICKSILPPCIQSKICEFNNGSLICCITNSYSKC
jgi:hypothetical protein